MHRFTFSLLVLAFSACSSTSPTGTALQPVGESCSSDFDCDPADYCDTLGTSTCQVRGGATDFDPCPSAYAGTSTPCAGDRVCGPCAWEWCAEPYACLTSSDYCAAIHLVPPEACADPICAPTYLDCFCQEAACEPAACVDAPVCGGP